MDESQRTGSCSADRWRTLLWTARRVLESRATTEQTAGLELQTAAWRRQAVQPFPEKAGAGVSNQQPSGDSSWSSVLKQEERLLQLKSQKTERMISWGILRERFTSLAQPERLRWAGCRKESGISSGLGGETLPRS